MTAYRPGTFGRSRASGARRGSSALSGSSDSRWRGRPGDPLGGALNEALVALWVLLVTLGVLWGVAAAMPFHNDESQYLWRARYFSYLFVERDLSRQKWGNSYATHTQPMLANYVIGGWLWAIGYDVTALEVLSPEEPSSDDPDTARRRYLVDTDLLLEARRPIVAFGAGVILLLYLLGRSLAGRVAELAAAALPIDGGLPQERARW